MRVTLKRALRICLGAATVSTALLTGAGVSSAMTPAVHAAPAPPGTQLWVSRYAGPGSGVTDYAVAEATGPAGDVLYVTGTSTGVTTPSDAVTVAYDAASGRRLWLRTHREASGADVAVNPRRAVVYVVGEAGGPASGTDFATLAYDARTGRLLWQATYNGPANLQDAASSVAVSPDGKTVFVTGYSWRGPQNNDDYVTIAYNAVTGGRLWVSRYNGPAASRNSIDEPVAIVAGPGGQKVFVTGVSWGRGSWYDYATVAYSAATGKQLWVKRYNGTGNFEDAPASLAVDRAGRSVFVTGTSAADSKGSINDYATVAYNAGTGARRWVQRYHGPDGGRAGAASVAVSPGGAAVYVTGGSHGAAATIAYRASSGARLWVTRYSTPEGAAGASSVAAGPGGRTVFITGASPGGYLTIAYDAATGARHWLRTYRGPGNDDGATCVVVSPGGSRVFVTGRSAGSDGLGDFATIAYSN